MSTYRFGVMPNFGFGEDTFVSWNDPFSDEEIDKIHKIAESRKKDEATIGEGDQNTTYRSSEVAWIEHCEETDWLYSCLAYIANQLNGQFYKFDLFGFDEHFQYTVYDASKEGHYDWHVDAGKPQSNARKLSLVIQLSDPSEYEGGDLELMVSNTPLKVDKKKGAIVAFPSYVLHRVTPVTSGIRKTMVIWVTGPKFK